MKKNARGILLRLAAATVITLALTAQAPGNIGGCGAQNSVADAPMHCVNFELAKCTRDLESGRFSQEEFQSCTDGNRITATCGGAAWPPGCAPSSQQSEACITLLRTREFLDLTNDELLMMYDDCNLCE